MAKAKAAPKAEAKPTVAPTTSGVKKTRSRAPATKKDLTAKEVTIPNATVTKKTPAAKRASVPKKAPALKKTESEVVGTPTAGPTPTAVEFGLALDTIPHETLLRVLKKLHGQHDFEDALMKELLVPKDSVTEWKNGENHVRPDLVDFSVDDEENGYDDNDLEGIYNEYAQRNEPVAGEQAEVEGSQEKNVDDTTVPEHKGFRPRYAICFNCKEEFDVSKNELESCRYHPGKYSFDSTGLVDQLHLLTASLI